MNIISKIAEAGAVATLALAVALPAPAQADPMSDIFTAALTARLAPACGVRPASWGDQVALGAEAAVQAVLPNTGMFPSSSQLATMQMDEATADGALADGKYLFADYGKQACKAFLDDKSLQNADTLASNAPISGQPGGWIPSQAIEIAWDASRADVAVSCKIRSETWLKNADTPILKKLLDAALMSAQPMDEDQKNAAIQAANKLLTFDRTIAVSEILAYRPAACQTIKNSPEIASVDKWLKDWQSQTNPWAGAGGN